MNVLFLLGVYPSYGGVEKVTTILANEFVKRGLGVIIVSFDQPYPELAKKELDRSVCLYKLSYPVYSRSNVQKLHNVITTKKVDVVINQWCVPFYVARLCSKAIKGTSCKLVSVHHNSPDTNARIKAIEIKQEKKQGLAMVNNISLALVKCVSRLSLRYTYSRSDVFVVLSSSFISLAERFMYMHGSNKILCLPNPLTISKPKNIYIEQKRKRIVCVGRIEYNQKRTFRVVDVWSKLEKKYPDWDLYIVGDGPDRRNLERYIDELGLYNVKITGFVDPVEFYKTSSLLMLTSEYEGFGLVLVEGQAYGVVPVVYGSYSAAYDIVKNEENGMICKPPFDADLMARQVENLMTDETKRTTMANKCVESVEKFDIDCIVDKWIYLFNDFKCHES